MELLTSAEFARGRFAAAASHHTNLLRTMPVSVTQEHGPGGRLFSGDRVAVLAGQQAQVEAQTLSRDTLATGIGGASANYKFPSAAAGNNGTSSSSNASPTLPNSIGDPKSNINANTINTLMNRRRNVNSKTNTNNNTQNWRQAQTDRAPLHAARHQQHYVAKQPTTDEYSGKTLIGEYVGSAGPGGLAFKEEQLPVEFGPPLGPFLMTKENLDQCRALRRTVPEMFG